MSELHPAHSLKFCAVGDDTFQYKLSPFQIYAKKILSVFGQKKSVITTESICFSHSSQKKTLINEMFMRKK